MAIVGTFILAFGWFGFNPGSTLSGTDLRISVVVVNTMLASVTGALGARCCTCMVTGKKPDPSMMCNGMLAGLVAITAPCAFVDTWAACVIGAVAGVLVVWAVFFLDNVRRRRSGRCHLGPRRQRPLGRDLARHLRHRQVRRGLERRRARARSVDRRAVPTASAAFSTAMPASSGRSCSTPVCRPGVWLRRWPRSGSSSAT